MITLPTKFNNENIKGGDSPSIIIDLQESILEVEETLQVDWQNNTGELNVDYSTQVGDVLLDGNFLTASFETGGDAFFGGSYEPDFVQGFKVDSTSLVDYIEVYLKLSVPGSHSTTAKIATTMSTGLVSGGAGPGSIVATSSSVSVNSTTAAWYRFDFSGISLTPGTQYYLFIDTSSATVSPYTDINNGYADGSFYYIDSTPDIEWVNDTVRDMYFRVHVEYRPSGYILTDEMDLGSIPTNDGQWVFSDLTPDDSSITYEAWSSSSGVFGGEETYLGSVIDGQAITDQKRYFKVKATFTSNSDGTQSPTLQSIKADFTSFITYSDNPDLGYEIALKTISSLTTSIDTFSPSTVGQMTLTLDNTSSVSDWINTKYPKNKDVIIYAGFRAEGWTKQDHIEFFHGQIDDWSLNAQNQIVIIVKDFSKEWSADVPAKWETAADDVTWTAQHHVDVMLDILQNQINVRDSKIDLDSFAVVKAALSGWAVTRTITDDSESAKDLMEELRILISAFFIPNSDGSVRLKRFDSTEATVDDLTDDDFIGVPTWSANADSLKNRTLIYLNWNGTGDDPSDYTDIDISADVTSQTNYGEIATYELRDKWTKTAQKATQITNGLASDILDRYADPPATLNVTVDRRWIALEPGDMVGITTVNAPSSDGAGISGVKFQIVNKNLDFLKDVIKLKLLEV